MMEGRELSRHLQRANVDGPLFAVVGRFHLGYYRIL
jgi:hypothetical protein